MNNLNKAIYAGLAQVGITDEGVKRALYVRVTSKPRLTLMSDPEKEGVVAELRRLGFMTGEARRPDGRRKLTGKYRPKLQALWIAGYNLGVIDNPDDAAMLDFIKGTTGADDTRFLHEHAAGKKAIEGLKAWLNRKAGVRWDDPVRRPKNRAVPFGYMIASAQWAILCPDGAGDFWKVVTDLVDQDELYRGHTDAEWITVMNCLGKRIRQGKKAVAR